MKNTTIEIVEHMLSEMVCNPEFYDNSPFNIKELSECIAMSIIKDSYKLSEPKLSLRKLREVDDDRSRVQDGRNMAYVKHYRDIQYGDIKNKTGFEAKELCAKDLKTISEKLEGYEITEMQYYESHLFSNMLLLKSIAKKRLCSSKKVSNAEFKEYMLEYEKVVNDTE